MLDTLEDLALRQLQRVAFRAEGIEEDLPPFVDDELAATAVLANHADELADEVEPGLIRVIEADPYNDIAIMAEAEAAERAWRDRAFPGSMEVALSPIYARALATGDAALSSTRLSDLERMRLINNMVRSGKYYTNNYFNTQVMPALVSAVDSARLNQDRNIALDTIRATLDRRLRSVPYWNVVANAAASRSYHYGLIHSGVRAGYRFVSFKARVDTRTSKTCLELNGRTWAALDMLTLVNKIAAADPEEVKTLAPWVKYTEITGKSDRDLYLMGVCIPPLHGRCRSQLVFTV